VSQNPALIERDLWAVPAKATAQWLALRDALEEAGPVACQTSDAEAWWPDHKDVQGPAARMAIAACRRCEAAGPCLAYALAADHRYGIWGATLPEERRAMRWNAANERANDED
jgi:hypothetical protein